MDKARQLRDTLRQLMIAQGALEEARRPCGASLPMPHAYALLALLRDGPMKVSALAAQLHIDRTNVSRLCARMEKLGELARSADPGDGRARLVGLTPRGEEVARAVDASSAAHFAPLVEALGPDHEATLQALARLTQILTEKENP